ncbi:alpha/beta fold hydrolase [Geodermatophilus sp. FMUSA9-8]|uniref:alpha/beta fold hydrolase n=1 Tax=Geodermatophilus sp. FMUSA9-8 TaxID=3120155 RepID=UPI00300936EA
MPRRRRATPPAPRIPIVPGTGGPPPPGSRTVRTDDGVDLHVEFDGTEDAPVTVVFCHGFTARLGEWQLQREAVRDRARLVLWDHRGHGRSSWADPTTATIDRTARDLGQVLDAVVPAGQPVVLAGHSMGGMTVMAYARQRPQEIGTRVVGAFLLATSAGGLVSEGLLGAAVGLMRRLHLLPLYLWWLRLLAPFLERHRRRGTRIGRRAMRTYLFGRDDATPEAVRVVQDMLEETPLTVTMAFYGTFLDHDETTALPVLGRVPTAVVAAEYDRLTPAAHGRRLAELLGPGCELVVVPGAGHSVNLTRTSVVDEALVALLDRVAAGDARRAG